MHYRRREEEEIIYTANDIQLKSEIHQRRLWIMMKDKNLPRRAWLDLLADAFRDSNAIFLSEAGDEYELPEIDDVFDCAEMRWISEFLRAAPCGKKPRARSRKLERLRMIDLYFKVTSPNTNDTMRPQSHREAHVTQRKLKS